MVNPTIKKLSKPGLSGTAAAELLRKHIGHSPTEEFCRQTISALRRIKNLEASVPASVVATLTLSYDDQCQALMAAIEQLQNYDHLVRQQKANGVNIDDA